MSHRNQGLTLIELLIVLAIIAILIILSILTWNVQLTKAKDAEKKDHLKRIHLAFEQYYSDNDCYPTANIIDVCNSDTLKPYLSSIPCNPTNQTAYCYIVDPDNPDCGQNFRLLVPLGYASDPIIAQLGCDSDTFCGWEVTCADLGDSGYNYGVSSTNVPIANSDPEPVPSPSPSPSPSPNLSPSPGNWACTPDGDCNSYANSEDCPITFADPVECATYCPTSPPENRCPY